MHTLQNWANRKLLVPVAQTTGKGGLRLYDKAQILLVWIAHQLTGRGVEAASAILIAAAVVETVTHEMRITARQDNVARQDCLDRLLNLCTVVSGKIADHANPLRVQLYDCRKDRHGIDDITEPLIVVPVGRIVAEVLAAEERQVS